MNPLRVFEPSVCLLWGYENEAVALAPGVVVCAMSIGLAPSAWASPPVEGGEVQQPKYCSVLVGKAPEGQDSPVIAKACSNESQAAADDQLQFRTQRSISAATNLMIWYANTGLSGNSTVIYGNAGPCDGGGYRVVPNTYWQTNMSSIRRQQTCDRATLFNRPQTQRGTFVLDTPTIGSFDNNVGRVQVFSSFA